MENRKYHLLLRQALGYNDKSIEELHPTIMCQLQYYCRNLVEEDKFDNMEDLTFKAGSFLEALLLSE